MIKLIINGFLTFRNDTYLQRSRKPIHSPLKTLSLYIHKLQANLSYFFLNVVLTWNQVVGALIVANVALVSLWWQLEDFLKWFLAGFAALVSYNFY